MRQSLPGEAVAGIRVFACTVLLLSIGAAAGEAQHRVAVVVLDSSSRATIPGASIEFRDSTGRPVWRGVADAAGSVIALVERGRWNARAEAPGYQRLDVMVEVADSALRFALLPAPLDVDAIAVDTRARRAASALERSGFTQRRERRRFGHFIDHREIEERNVHTVSEILRRMTGVRIEPGTVGSPLVHMRAGELPDLAGGTVICGPRVVRDGITVHTGGRSNPAPIDDLVQTVEIAGLEVYRSTAEVPAEFAGGMNGCGLIAIWTR